jgi:GGDEF domain-containing protein
MTTDQLVCDPATGLFSEALLRAVLPSRVATARRTLRQLGLALVSVDDGPDPTVLADLVVSSVRDSDMAGRLDDGTLAIILEFTPADGCRIVVERLHDRILESANNARVRAGVACYPVHAVSATELMEIAHTALDGAPDGETRVAPVPE